MDANGIERPVLAVDVAVFTMTEKRLLALTHNRRAEPFKGAPALPGAAVRVDETLEDAARRALAEKAALPSPAPDHVFLEQLAAFDGIYRDPRGRTVSVAFMGVIRSDDAPLGAAGWKAAADLVRASLPFDHSLIVETGIQRLRGKLRYTNIAKGFLPEAFRIDALQDVYEAVLDRELNRTNFRNKLLKIGLIEQVDIQADAVGSKGGRPPHLYRFTGDLVGSVDRDFL